jgi:hypothetical protein
MGFRIIKAEHREDQVGHGRRLQKLHKDAALDNYLWNYIDYVVSKGRLIHLVDVKSQPVQQLKVGRKLETFGNESVSFTDKELMAYPKARIPVRILLIRYRDNAELRKLGPVNYCYVPFKQFHFKEDWAGGFPPENALWKTLTSAQAYELLRKSSVFERDWCMMRPERK